MAKLKNKDIVMLVKKELNIRELVKDIEKVFSKGIPKDFYGSFFMNNKGDLDFGTVESYSKGSITVNFSYGNRDILLTSMTPDEVLLLALVVIKE